MRKDRNRACAFGVDRATIGDRNHAANASPGPCARADRRLSIAIKTNGAASRKATGPAAAANRLRKDAKGEAAQCQHTAANAVANRYRTAVTASTTGAANHVRRRIRLGTRAADREAALTATAANRLRKHRRRIGTRRLRDAAIGHADHAASTASPARTANAVRCRATRSRQSAARRETTRAAAAANRLRKHCQRAIAQRHDLARTAKRNPAASTRASTSAAADLGRRIAINRQRAACGKAASTAAAANRLRKHAEGLRARRADHAAIGNVDQAAITASPAGTANHFGSAIRLAARSADREAAHAAAAANRLRKHRRCILAIGQDLAGRGQRNHATLTASTTFAANCIGSRAAVRGQAAASRKAASTAAATDRLRKHANRAIARRADRAAIGDGDLAAIAAAGTHARAHGRASIPAGAQRAACSKAALAATAANRLRKHAIGQYAHRGDRTGAAVINRDIAASPASAARTANRAGRAGQLGSANADREAALTAAAANRLRKHCRGIRALGLDHARVRSANQPASATSAARTTDRVIGRTARCRKRRANREATSAAAAANRLGKHCNRACALCANQARAGNRNRAARAATAAGTAANATCGVIIKAKRRPDGKAARTAAAADGLRINAKAVCANGSDLAAVVINANLAARAAASTFAANRAGYAARMRSRRANREATGTTAATNRLRKDARSVLALRANRAAAGHRNHAARARTRACTANAVGHAAAIGAQPAACGKTALTAAAANRLREHRKRIIAARGNAARIGQRDLAARTAATASTRTDARIDIAINAQRAASGKTALTAAAANRLRKYAVGEGTSGLDDTIGFVINRNNAASATSAARAANQIRRALGLSRSRTRREAANAAAAANRLRKHRCRIDTQRLDQPVIGQANRAAKAAQATRATNGAAGRTARGRQAARHGKAARTAAAADRLRQDTKRIIAHRADAASIADRHIAR